jgi:uncharacterized protein (TIGR03000 family)
MGGGGFSRGFAPSAFRGSPGTAFRGHANLNSFRGRNGDFGRGGRDFRSDRGFGRFDHGFRGDRGFGRFDRGFGFGGGWWGPGWGWWGPWGWGDNWYGSYPYYDSYAYGGSPGYSSFYSGPTTYYDDTLQGQPPADEGYTEDNRPRGGSAIAENAALIAVRVPANTEVWFQGKKTSETGTVRQFQTPPLDPGQGYTYNVRARWKEGGREIDQTRKLAVRAGDRLGISFMPPSAPAPEP